MIRTTVSRNVDAMCAAIEQRNFSKLRRKIIRLTMSSVKQNRREGTSHFPGGTPVPKTHKALSQAHRPVRFYQKRIGK